MSKYDWRDDFAAMALIGELCSQNESSGDYQPPFGTLAERCYDIADAMVNERKRRSVENEQDAY